MELPKLVEIAKIDTLVRDELSNLLLILNLIDELLGSSLFWIHLEVLMFKFLCLINNFIFESDLKIFLKYFFGTYLHFLINLNSHYSYCPELT